MSNNACLPRETLKEYLTGWTSPKESDSIEEHLKTCEICEQTIAELDGDPNTLSDMVRAAGRSSLSVQDGLCPDGLDSVVAYALSRAKQIPEGREERVAVAMQAFREIGPYELLSPLGQGGMGAVYLARHRQLGKQVAIKLLPPRTFRGEHNTARFQREIRAAGALNHPAIVSATDAGEHESTHYLAMEFVDGLDLSRIARLTGPLSIADGCAIAHAVALGLSHAHAAGIVHRDIKPSNVMLACNGQVKILDFGLAQVSLWDEVSAELTTVGQLMGTLDYMAPEQAERANSVDYRADLYSLGAMLFRLLCGRAPLAATPDLSPLAKLQMLATHESPSLSTLRPDASSILTELVRSLLARDPSNRPASAAHVAERLVELMVGADLPALVANAKLKQATQVQPTGLSQDSALHDAMPAPKRRKIEINGRLIRWLTAASVVSILLIGGVLVTLETQKGQLVIESVNANVEVTLARDGKFVDRLSIVPGATTTRLYAGKYEVKIDVGSDQVTLDRDTIEIKRGQTLIARVTTKDSSKDAMSRSLVQPALIVPPANSDDLLPGQRFTFRSRADDSLKADFVIHADYSVKLPLIGVVSVKGRDIEDLEFWLNERYKTHLKNPWIEVYPDYKAMYSAIPTSNAQSATPSSTSLVPAVSLSPAARSVADVLTGLEPTYMGKTLTAWLEQFAREREPSELRNATNALYVLANPEYATSIAETMLKSCRLHSEGEDRTTFQVIAKAQKSREAYVDLLVRELEKADNAWAYRILTSATLVWIAKDKHKSGDLMPLFGWLRKNVLQAETKSQLLMAAAECLAHELLLDSGLSDEVRASLLNDLRNEHRLGNDFWLEAPPAAHPAGFRTYDIHFAQTKLAKAIDVLIAETSLPQEVARAALMMNVFYGSEYDRSGLSTPARIDELSPAIARRLKKMRESKDSLFEWISVESEYSSECIPRLLNPLPELNFVFGVSIKQATEPVPCLPVIELLELAMKLSLIDGCFHECTMLIDHVSPIVFSLVQHLGRSPFGRFVPMGSKGRGLSNELRVSIEWPINNWHLQNRGPSDPSKNDWSGFYIFAKALSVFPKDQKQQLINRESELLKVRWCENLIREFDENRDGRLSVDEAKGTSANLEAADVDADRLISVKEYCDYLESQARPRVSG